ncbi:hypothetical protein BLNAU_10290 [Blattamonas nauphoetae]|uniref:AIR9-like A9 domain-containing protein n=1 Tax=Blattamonas nauphoetae TaxID=2049346 RepID=A0ABQ9XTK6_9EUKA|nr:hypothetical protein BLNAU_10290 [Blattamonas nauphoetae]
MHTSTKKPLVRRKQNALAEKTSTTLDKPSLTWKSRLTSLSQNRSSLSTLSETAQESKLVQVRAFEGRVELNNCSLKTIDGLDDKQTIEFLYLRNNYLSYIPFTLELNSLRILDISCNQISSLTFLSRLPSLKQLYCNFNNVSKLPALEAPHPSLEIDTFDSLVERHETSLKSIRIDNNPISDSDHCSDFTRTVLLVCFPQLSRIDGTTVTEDERRKAAEYPHKLATCIRLGMPINGEVALSAEPSSFNEICDIYLKELQIPAVDDKGFKLSEIGLSGDSIEGEKLIGNCSICFDDGSYDPQSDDGMSGDEVRMSSESFDLRARAAAAMSKECKLKYRWLREQDDGTFAPIEGEETDSYVLTKVDVSRAVRFEVMASYDDHAVIVFALSNNILAANPKCLSIDIEGDLVEESTIKAVAHCVGVDTSKGSYKFERVLADISKYPPVIAEPQQIEMIRESNSNELKLCTDDVGCFIRVTHVPANVLGATGEPFTFLSALVIPVLPRVSNVRIQGDLIEGSFLEGAGDYGGGEEGTSEYSWATRKPGEDKWIDVEEEKAEIEKETLAKRRELENRSRASLQSADPSLSPPQSTTREDDAASGKTIMQTISTVFVPSAIHCDREVRFGYTPVSQFGVRGQTVYGYTDGTIKAGRPSVSEIVLPGPHVEGEKVFVEYKYNGGMEGESEIVWVRLHEDPAVVCAPPKQSPSPIPQKSPSLSPKPPGEDGNHTLGHSESQASNVSSKSQRKSTAGQPKTTGKSQAAPRVSTGKSVVQFAPINPKAKGSGQSQSKVFRGTRPTQSIVSHMRNNIYQPKDEEKKVKKLEDIEFTVVGRGKEYVCVKEDIGKVLAVKIRAVRADGVKCPTESMEAAKEKVKPTTPKFTSIKVNGQRQEGEDLIVETTYVGGNEGRSEFSWFVEEKDQEKIEKMKKQSQKAKRSAQTSPQRQPGQMAGSHSLYSFGNAGGQGPTSSGPGVNRFGAGGMHMRSQSYAQPSAAAPTAQLGRYPSQLSPRGSSASISPRNVNRTTSPTHSGPPSPTRELEGTDSQTEEEGEKETSNWAPLELCDNKLFSPTLICVGKRVKVVGVPIREDNVRGEPSEFIIEDLIIPALPKSYRLTLKLNEEEEKEKEKETEKKSRQSEEALKLKRFAFVLPSTVTQSLQIEPAVSPSPAPSDSKKRKEGDTATDEDEEEIEEVEKRRDGEIRVGDSLKIDYRYFGGVEGSSFIRWRRDMPSLTTSPAMTQAGVPLLKEKKKKQEGDEQVVGFGPEYKVQEDDICKTLTAVVIAERNDGVKTTNPSVESWRERVQFDGVIPKDVRIVIANDENCRQDADEEKETGDSQETKNDDEQQDKATTEESEEKKDEDAKSTKSSHVDEKEEKDDEGRSTKSSQAEEEEEKQEEDNSETKSSSSKRSQSVHSQAAESHHSQKDESADSVKDTTADDCQPESTDEPVNDEAASIRSETSQQASAPLSIKSGDVLRVEYSHDGQRFESNTVLMNILKQYAESLQTEEAPVSTKEEVKEDEETEEGKTEEDKKKEDNGDEEKPEEKEEKPEEQTESKEEEPTTLTETEKGEGETEDIETPPKDESTPAEERKEEKDEENKEDEPKEEGELKTDRNDEQDNEDAPTVLSPTKASTSESSDSASEETQSEIASSRTPSPAPIESDPFVRIDWIGIDSDNVEHLLATNTKTFLVTNEVQGMQIICRVAGLRVVFGMAEGDTADMKGILEDGLVVDNVKGIWESEPTEPAIYVPSEEEMKAEEERLRKEEEERLRQEEEERMRVEEEERMKIEEEERLKREEEEKIAREKAEEEERLRKEEEDRQAQEKAEEDEKLEKEAEEKAQDEEAEPQEEKKDETQSEETKEEEKKEDGDETAPSEDEPKAEAQAEETKEEEKAETSVEEEKKEETPETDVSQKGENDSEAPQPAEEEQPKETEEIPESEKQKEEVATDEQRPESVPTEEAKEEGSVPSEGGDKKEEDDAKEEGQEGEEKKEEGQDAIKEEEKKEDVEQTAEEKEETNENEEKKEESKPETEQAEDEQKKEDGSEPVAETKDTPASDEVKNEEDGHVEEQKDKEPSADEINEGDKHEEEAKPAEEESKVEGDSENKVEEKNEDETGEKKEEVVQDEQKGEPSSEEHKDEGETPSETAKSEEPKNEDETKEEQPAEDAEKEVGQKEEEVKDETKEEKKEEQPVDEQTQESAVAEEKATDESTPSATTQSEEKKDEEAPKDDVEPDAEKQAEVKEEEDKKEDTPVPDSE